MIRMVGMGRDIGADSSFREGQTQCILYKQRDIFLMPHKFLDLILNPTVGSGQGFQMEGKFVGG
jgi:hypothetical protein